MFGGEWLLFRFVKFGLGVGLLLHTVAIALFEFLFEG